MSTLVCTVNGKTVVTHGSHPILNLIGNHVHKMTCSTIPPPARGVLPVWVAVIIFVAIVGFFLRLGYYALRPSFTTTGDGP